MSEDVQSGLTKTMRLHPQGVTVVTTQGPGGPKAITIGTFTSVSLAPPLVLFCIARSSTLHDVFIKAGSYAINFLADDQVPISDRFAGRTAAKGEFESLGYEEGVTGSPIISGVRAVIECRAWRTYDGGDHSILVGEVVFADALEPKPPLVYLSQQYTTTERLDHP